MVAIRPAQPSDLPAISALDARLTGLDKPDYWRDMLAPDRHFLVAETEAGALLGFIAGEVRAWEFGQPAAGWVFAIQIDPKQRQRGVGSALFDALVARFKSKGVTRVRTLSGAGLVRGGRGAAGGYRFTGNRRRITLMDIVGLFEPAPGQRAKEPGEDTDIGATLQRVLLEVDEIAEATLRSISLETMLK